MNEEIRKALLKLAEEQHIPSDLAELASRFVEGEGEEAVTIDQYGQSKSIKFSNLRFRLRDFFLEVVKTGYGIVTSKDIVAATLLVVPFFQKVKKLATYPIGKTEALVLANLFWLEYEHQPVNFDLLQKHMDGLKQDELEASLFSLEVLGCISWTEQSIRIEEEIEFKQAKPPDDLKA